jgi:hypothetical protein
VLREKVSFAGEARLDGQSKKRREAEAMRRLQTEFKCLRD